MSEKELINGCKKGKPTAQKALYDQYARTMMGVCLRYVSDRDTAQDLLQEGFIKVFTSIASYNNTGALGAWIRRIFVNTALEHLRKNDILRTSVEIDEVGTLSDMSGDVLAKIGADELLQMVAQLPVGFRTVFNMYVIEGYSHKEIADELVITESTSRSQLTRAKRILQQQIEELVE